MFSATQNIGPEINLPSCKSIFQNARVCPPECIKVKSRDNANRCTMPVESASSGQPIRMSSSNVENLRHCSLDNWSNFSSIRAALQSLLEKV